MQKGCSAVRNGLDHRFIRKKESGLGDTLHFQIQKSHKHLLNRRAAGLYAIYRGTYSISVFMSYFNIILSTLSA